MPPKQSGVIKNRLAIEDRAAHDWYRFVLSFPPHLVRDYLKKFEVTRQMTVLDPFCGTGTTLVECKKLGIQSVGIEANSMAHFAAQTKVCWSANAACLCEMADEIAARTEKILQAESGHNLRELPPDSQKILLTNSISPVPLHKTLVLLESIEAMESSRFERYFKIALASALVGPIGNLRFGPEVGVSNKLKTDAPVLEAWLLKVRSIADDLQKLSALQEVPATLYHADARTLPFSVPPASIDAVITSPPYPNEKDYTRTTRLESALLGFLNSKTELRALKKTLLRSNTRNVYQGDEDDVCIAHHPEVMRVAAAIEARRIELGKTSGFERLYHRVTTLYFGGMARHLASLKTVLRPGASLAYVVGDQASYLRVMIRTGQLLATVTRSHRGDCARREAVDYRRARTRVIPLRLGRVLRDYAPSRSGSNQDSRRHARHHRPLRFRR